MNSKISLHLLAFISTVLLVCDTGYAASGQILAEVRTPAIDPGLSNVQFWGVDAGPVIGAKGHVAFTAQLADDSGGSSISTINDHSLWIGTQDDLLGMQLRLAIQENDSAPGTETGVVFGNINAASATQLIVGDNGSVAVETVVKGTGVTGANNTGLWLIAPDDTITLITREGFQFSAIHEWSFVESAANGPFLALRATEQVSGYIGIWRWSPVSGFEQVALFTSPAPSVFPNCTYGGISRPVINRHGEIAFDATLAKEVPLADCPPTLFRWSGGGEPQALVSYGDGVPNFPVDSTFSGFAIGANNVDPKINDAGGVLFASRLSIRAGPQSIATRNSLWVAKSNGDLALAMVANQLLPGSTMEWLGTPGINRYALSASGTVTLLATTDTFGKDVILSGTPTTAYNFTALDDFGTNGLEVIARVGEPEPGTGILFGNLNQSLINSSGKLAFTMYGGLEAHWTGSNPNNLELIARSLDPMDFGGVPRTVASFSGVSLVTAGETGGTGNSDGLPSQFSDTGQVVFRAAMADPSANAIVLYPQDPYPDADGDGILDDFDNCTLVPNGSLIPDAGGNVQLDTDGDGYGNLCDADLNNTGFVDFGDLSLFQAAFFTADPDADFNGTSFVDFGDLSLFQEAFFQPPGPSCIDLPGGCAP